MKKYTIISLSSLFLIGMSVFSCSKSLDNSEETLPQKKVNANIPANFASSKVVADGGAATFSTSEKVYVYNNATSTLDADYLSPDADGATANLKGSLSGTYSAGNSLKLLYNTTSEGIADYTNQDGTLENVVDAATATVKVQTADAESFTTRTAYFENLQSIFKFTFKDPDDNVINVRFVSIVSENNKLQSSYDILNETPTYGSVSIANKTTQTTVYVALRFTSNPSETILFSVVDENGKVYTGTKTSPSTGFKIGRFYSSTITVQAHTFTIASGKKVYFAPSNLYFEDGEYKFLSSTFINKELFNTESTRPTVASSANCIEVYDIPGWYVPSNHEWEMLGHGYYDVGRRFVDAPSLDIMAYRIITDERTNNVFGLLLLPDDYTNAERKEELEKEEKYSTNSNMYYFKKNVNIFKYLAKGCVFLPDAPDKNAHSYYLSTTGYELRFSKDGYSSSYGILPYSGFGGSTATEAAVRLIHEE